MADEITAERSRAAFELQKRHRLGVLPSRDGNGWLIQGPAGTFIGSAAAATQEEALERAAAAIEAGERRNELQELRGLIAALSRGRYYPLPVLSKEEPQALTFDVVARDGFETRATGVPTWQEAALMVQQLDAAASETERGRPAIPSRGRNET